MKFIFIYSVIFFSFQINAQTTVVPVGPIEQKLHNSLEQEEKRILAICEDLASEIKVELGYYKKLNERGEFAPLSYEEAIESLKGLSSAMDEELAAKNETLTNGEKACLIGIKEYGLSSAQKLQKYVDDHGATIRKLKAGVEFEHLKVAIWEPIVEIHGKVVEKAKRGYVKTSSFLSEKKEMAKEKTNSMLDAISDFFKNLKF